MQERLLVRVALELLNQLFDYVCVLLFDCRMEYAGFSVVNVVAPGFPGTLRCACVVTRCSCVLFLLILLSTLRIRFQYNTWHTWGLVYLVEKLLLRLHAYRFLNTSHKQCVVENDCV